MYSCVYPMNSRFSYFIYKGECSLYELQTLLLFIFVDCGFTVLQKLQILQWCLLYGCIPWVGGSPTTISLCEYVSHKLEVLQLFVSQKLELFQQYFWVKMYPIVTNPTAYKP